MVVPSLNEPFGIVALEGMVNRVPVVIADSGGLGEIVEDGRTGLKVPPRNPQALAQAITRLLLDEALRRQIGQAGYEQAVVRYQWADVARQTVEAYGVGVPVPSQ
jgi:glycosyltransferase involved in cell wall biosynthesis